MKFDIIVPAIVALAVGCIPALLTYLISKRKAGAEGEKIRAEAVAILTDAAGDMVTRLCAEVEALHVEIASLQDRLLKSEQRIIRLRTGLAEAQAVLRATKAESVTAQKRISDLERENRELRGITNRLDKPAITDQIEQLLEK